MKKTIFSLFLVALSLNAWAQKDKYTKQVAEKTCDCLNKKTIAGKESSLDLKDITDCLGTGGFGEFYKEVAKEHNIDVTGGLNEQTGSLVGEKIGIKLVEIDCAAYKAFIYKYMDIDKDGKKVDKPIEKPSTKTTYFTDYFTFQRIENTDNFATLIAKDDKGREIKFWWWNYFEGSEIFQSSSNSLKGKKLTFTWWEEEVYSPKLSDYVKVKVLKVVKE